MLEEEYLRWLTERGSGHGDGTRNRPVLLRADGTGISQSVAEKKMKAILSDRMCDDHCVFLVHHNLN